MDQSSIGILIVVLLFMGTVFFIVGLKSVIRHHAITCKPYQTVAGAIEGLEERRDNNGSSYYPIYNFYYMGKMYRVVGGVNVFPRSAQKPNKRRAYAPGDSVQIRVYDDPNKAVLDNSDIINMYKTTGIVFGLCGLMFLIIAVSLIVYR